MLFGKESNMIVIKLDDGENLHSGIEQALGQNMVKSGIILGGVGMLADFKLGYYDGKEYITQEFKEPHELLTLQGSVAHGGQGKILLHVHCTVANRAQQVFGGHLISGTVRYANEIFVLRLVDIELGRRKNERTGLMELEIHKTSDIKLHSTAARHRHGSLELDLD
ncbi:MAG: DUF296 domain-containing protein [Euryarchaeota archaeon]|nr:DUF296 domain-containing protein [Euryarchaeota archaeon]